MITIATCGLRRAVLAPIVLVGTLFSAAITAQTIWIEGRGTVEIEPEYARMSASVSHTADTTADVEGMVDHVMSQLLAGVEEPPISEDSIDAGYIRIQPRYRWNPRSETQEFQGYSDPNAGLQAHLTRILG